MKMKMRVPAEIIVVDDYDHSSGSGEGFLFVVAAHSPGLLVDVDFLPIQNWGSSSNPDCIF